MMHKAWSSIEEVPYCFSRSSVKLQGHTAIKIVDFKVICQISRSHGSIVFEDHLSHYKVTQDIIVGNFELNWAFSDYNSYFNSPMLTKCCTKFAGTQKKCLLIYFCLFWGPLSNLESNRPKIQSFGSDLRISVHSLQFQFMDGYVWFQSLIERSYWKLRLLLCF